MKKGGERVKEDKIYMLQSKGPVPVFKHVLLSVDVFISRTPDTPVRENANKGKY